MFDRCTTQTRTSDLQSFNCPVQRNNSQITIGYTPPGYTQLYSLLNLDTSNATQLFTTPPFPGKHYTMRVNLWSNTNALVESQLINITTVFGHYLSVPLITFVIPLDANSKGLFDLSFTVGSADILPSY